MKICRTTVELFRSWRPCMGKFHLLWNGLKWNWSLNSDSKRCTMLLQSTLCLCFSLFNLLRDSPCLWNCPAQQWSGFQTRRPEGWGQLGSRGEHTEKGPPDSSAHQQTHSNCSDILHWKRKKECKSLSWYTWLCAISH